MKKFLLLVVVLLAMATRSSAQAVTKSDDPSVSLGRGHWAFFLTYEGESVGRYTVNFEQVTGSDYAIRGEVFPQQTGWTAGTSDPKSRARPLTGSYDRKTHAIAFTIMVDSPKGPQPVLFAGVHDWYTMRGAMVDGDGHLWSWTANTQFLR